MNPRCEQCGKTIWPSQFPVVLEWGKSKHPPETRVFLAPEISRAVHLGECDLAYREANPMKPVRRKRKPQSATPPPSDTPKRTVLRRKRKK